MIIMVRIGAAPGGAPTRPFSFEPPEVQRKRSMDCTDLSLNEVFLKQLVREEASLGTTMLNAL